MSKDITFIAICNRCRQSDEYPDFYAMQRAMQAGGYMEVSVGEGTKIVCSSCYSDLQDIREKYLAPMREEVGRAIEDFQPKGNLVSIGSEKPH